MQLGAARSIPAATPAIAVASAHETVTARRIPRWGKSALTHTDSHPGPGLKGGRDGRGEIPVKSSARMLKNPIVVPPSSNGDVLARATTTKRFRGAQWSNISGVRRAKLTRT